MKAVKYVGPFTEGVEIAATGQVVMPGESLNVDDDLADGLCVEVENWEPDGWELPTEPAAELAEEPVPDEPTPPATSDDSTSTEAGDGTTEES